MTRCCAPSTWSVRWPALSDLDALPGDPPARVARVRPGVVVGVDVGTVRVGVAASDPDRLLASPVETVPAPGHARVAAIVAERGAVLLVVGLPTSLSGKAESASAQMARDWAAKITPLVAPVPVEFIDERLTTVVATAALRASGRSAKKSRAVIDQVAAVALLQARLDRT